MRVRLSTEALAQTAARRPWTVLGIWALVLLLSLALVSAALSGALTNEGDFTNNPDSKRGEILLEERLSGQERLKEIVIVRSASFTVDDPAFRQFVEGLYENIAALGSDVIGQGTNYYQTGDQSLVSADRHTTLLPLILAGTDDDALDHVERIRRAIGDAKRDSPFQVLLTGQASTFKDSRDVAEQDLQAAEILGIPVALVILMLVFGAIAAAVIPLVLALVAIVVALGATALVGQAFELSFFVTNMITMMGLAVGIDYSLFIVSRYREERRRGLEKFDAIAAAGATASRAVFFSGLTVVLALLGMLIIPTTVFRSLAAGAILVVIAAVLASLTLLPAVLGLMGDNVQALRLPFLGRSPAKAGAKPNGFWDRVTRLVMRYPLISVVAASALLVSAALPYFQINTGQVGISALPDDLQSKEGFSILDKEFSGGLSSPVEVVIDGDISSPAVQTGIERLADIMESDPAFGPSRLQVNDGGDLALLAAPLRGDPDAPEALTAVERLRSQHIPQAFSSSDADVLVTGSTAFQVDFRELTDRYTPIVFAFVLGLSFVLLTIVFRSIVVPAKAIVMNLLSVGAAYGLLVLVFQKGVGASLLGFQRVETIEVWLPLFLFSVLFGLSMDYHVFLLSRIRERFSHSGDNAEAVAFGLRSTAGIITGAALIMVAVFAAFARGDLVMFQQMGFGLAVAVLLDATIVRSVLVPAAMQLLGARNWYLPSALRWLPHLRPEDTAGAVDSARAS